jgi:hypothetical protein
MKEIELMHILFLVFSMILTACGSGGGGGDSSGESDFTLSRGSPATLTTVRVSVDSSGSQSTTNESSTAAISSTGRYIVFESSASDLISGDSNTARDIFVHDRDADGDSKYDEPDAINTTRASVHSNGTQGNNDSYSPSISADGRYVAFESIASDLIASDTNGAVRDIFVHDRTTGTTTVVSVTSGGAQGNNDSYSPSISADGRYVAFESIASDLIASDTNGAVRDIFVHDRTTGTTTVVSVNSSGAQVTNDCLVPSISANGNFVSFESLDNNLVSNDSNGLKDIFVHAP